MTRMKILSSRLLASFIVLMMLLGACNSAKKMQQNVEEVSLKAVPKVLEVRGDSVSFSIKGKIPPKYFAKKAIVVLSPEITYSTSDGANRRVDDFRDYVLAGEKAYTGNIEVDQTVSSKEGADFSLDYTFAFKKDMEDADLEMNSIFKFISPKKEELDVGEEYNVEAETDTTLAVGTIITPYRTKETDKLVYEVSKKPIPESRSARIYYVINKSYIRRSEKRKEEVEQLRDFADREGFVLRGVRIVSAASPDGEYDLNKNLAKERSDAALSYVNQDLRDQGIESIQDSAFFARSNIDEDFDGLKNMLRQSDIKGRSKMLSILNSNAPKDVKEKRLREIETFEYVLENIMPKLRYSEITYTGYSRQRSIEELKKVMSEEGMEVMTYTELNRMAQTEGTNSQKERRLYEAMRERYPDRVGGHNNLGVWYIENGDYSRAINILEKASQKFPDEPMVKNNLGVAQRRLDQYENAMRNLMAANQGGLDNDNNLGIYYINVGKYAESVDAFEKVSCGRYNAALANTLYGNFDQAKRELECINQKDGLDYYLMAIIGARTGDEEMMTTGLRRAIEEDSKYREMARDDKEFYNYKGKQAFESALR